MIISLYSSFLRLSYLLPRAPGTTCNWARGSQVWRDWRHDEMRLYMPEPRPKLKITSETAAAHCRIAEAGDYTYIEQNTIKNSPWTRLAKKGHELWWEIHRGGDRRYTGRLIIDDQLYTVSEAKKVFKVK